MKRDDDFLRDLLFEFEEQKDWLILVPEWLGMPEDERRKQYHVLLLSDAGLVVGVGNSTYRLTAGGHDYLDVIRNEAVWERTKVGIAQVGGMTLGMIKDLAIAYTKQVAAEKLGIEL
ncbi:DUF2513 domain-containing protein [Halocynthiibacter sp.]|uniref:DUF2513 domain-containing protein n=1 Tax=Halocynthiibacter sp. TaxID=1979210 RepID=UPI003C3BD886